MSSAFETFQGPIRLIKATGNSSSVGCQAGAGVVVHDIPPAISAESGFMFNPTRAATGTRGFGNTVLNGRLLQDFVPAYEQALPDRPPGETHGTALLAWLAWSRARMGLDPQAMLFRSHGCAGKQLHQISKGSQPYANGLIEVDRAVAIAAAKGKTLVCEDCFLTNGNQDRTNGVSRADFTSRLDQLTMDQNDDWRPLTGQATPVRTWINQVGANNSLARCFGSDIPLAQLDFARRNPLGRMVGPRYIYGYGDVSHLVAERGYLWEGEYMARALFSESVSGKPWKALGQDLRVHREGRHVDIRFDRGGLVFDVDLVPPVINRGFALHGPGGDIALRGVALVSSEVEHDTVRLTLPDQPPSGPLHWSYAFNGPGSGARLAAGRASAGAWGNLRDSDAAESRHFAGEKLYNWCVILKEPVPE